jgi:hypothetical protein
MDQVKNSKGTYYDIDEVLEGQSGGISSSFCDMGQLTFSPRYEDEISFKRISDVVKRYSLANSGCRANSFKKNAWAFFVCKYKGYKNVEIARIFNITISAVSHWITRLGELISKYFPREELRFLMG